MVFLQVVVTLQATCYELCVVNEPIAIRIHYVHEINAIILSHGASRYLLYANLKLLDRELSISVLVKLRESVTESLDLILWDP